MLVKSVKFVDGKVEIKLEENSFFISKENYIENPVTIDSDIDEERIKFLLEQEEVIENKKFLIKILNKKNLTEKEVKEKLKDKNLKDKNIVEIIKSLKRMSLINDEYAGLLLVESLLLKRKGRLDIKSILKEKGLSEEIIDKLLDGIDEDIYKSNFDKVCEKYIKMYSNKSSKMREQMVVEKLKQYGYEDKYIKMLEINESCDEEVILAKQKLNKMLKNKNVDLNNYENLNKIKTKLLMQGFSYGIINMALEEVVKDETY